MHLHSYYNFYFEVTLFVIETIIVLKLASQVFTFILIQYFLFVHINTTIHAHTLGYYYYRHKLFYLLIIVSHKFNRFID